jgi:hypothetical protein
VPGSCATGRPWDSTSAVHRGCRGTSQAHLAGTWADDEVLDFLAVPRLSDQTLGRQQVNGIEESLARVTHLPAASAAGVEVESKDLSRFIDPHGGKDRQERVTTFCDGDAGDLQVTSDYRPRGTFSKLGALDTHGATIGDLEQQLVI